MAIKLKEIGYTYAPKSPFAFEALKNINTTIPEGKITAIIGATGSGKSTLVQHLNGLLLPTQGTLTIYDHTIKANEKPKGLKALRKRVGLVFQFPEMQLFEDTIYKDVSFGPRNFGMREPEIKTLVEEALRLVGIDQSLWERSPLNLSGGQQRRVAIAGVLATNPDLIVLDEPTAGLDPQGAKSMMRLFESLNKEHDKTIVMVTHDMEHVLQHADHVIVLDHAEIVFEGNTTSFFEHSHLLNTLDIVKPLILRLHDQLIAKGFNIPVMTDLEELTKRLAKEVVK
ncbi:MAG TPA: energy-coupling factor transporter ATPase [Erysipelothrix sp.]|nr:energy-coupling factor transporter ATPase [Erysipelothrix sp.]